LPAAVDDVRRGVKQIRAMRTSLARIALFCSVLSAFSCGGARIAVDTQQTYYLQHNLRANGTNIVSLNEWNSPTILPMCMPVQLVQASGRRIVFTANGQQYRYTIHRSSRIDLMTHLNRTFASPCPDVRSMTGLDQQGIQAGQPRIGMSRQAIVFALGYPPDHKTPSLEASPWTYWGNRGEVQVHFQGDNVANIMGNPAEPAVVMAQQAPAMPVQQAQPVQQTQPVAVTDEVMVVVTDPNGYPAQVPQSALGQPCDVRTPCHQALICNAGSCQTVDAQ
jgi:hypothetical protein